MLNYFLFIFCYILSVTFAETLIEIPQGKLKGKINTDIKGNEFYSFLSVPYIKPPIGKLRFKAPEAPEAWTGVFEATKDLEVCPQLNNQVVVGVEDCVKLNIHTPELPNPSGNSSLKPVVVFIHGGAFVEGSGHEKYFGAEFLMPTNVVLVTINYRLGLLGFLSSTNASIPIPGNAGLKDQSMALKWIQKNIKYFGGNPNLVTIVGESAGGASVHFQLLSPLSKGLFHRVILMSGSATNQWARGVLGTFESEAKRLGISENIFEKLQNIDVTNFFDLENKDGLLIPISKRFYSSPVVERDINNEMPMLTKTTLELISSNEYNKVPIMVGYTNADGLVFEIIYQLLKKSPYKVILNNLIPNDLELNEEQREMFKNELKQVYFGESNLNETSNYVQLLTSVYFLNGYTKLLKHHIENGDEIYFYRFSADTGLNYFKKQTEITSKFPGASHIDDLGHLFKTVESPEIKVGSDEEKAMNNMVRLFTNFAKFGKPTTENDEVSWAPVTKDAFNFMDIGTTLHAGVDPDKKSFDFWNEIYKKYA